MQCALIIFDLKIMKGIYKEPIEDNENMYRSSLFHDCTDRLIVADFKLQLAFSTEISLTAQPAHSAWAGEYADYISV